MELGPVLLLLALLLAVVLFLAAPFIKGRTSQTFQVDPEFSSLMAERDRILNALLELDFDFKLGKIPEAEYPAQRASLLEKGAGALRRLDNLSAAASIPAINSYGVKERLKKEVPEDHRTTAQHIAEVLDDERLESMLAARRAAREAKSSGFCTRCGKPVLVTDQFCSNCGKALSETSRTR